MVSLRYENKKQKTKNHHTSYVCLAATGSFVLWESFFRNNDQRRKKARTVIIMTPHRIEAEDELPHRKLKGIVVRTEDSSMDLKKQNFLRDDTCARETRSTRAHSCICVAASWSS